MSQVGTVWYRLQKAETIDRILERLKLDHSPMRGELHTALWTLKLDTLTALAVALELEMKP